jgi:hypothetical protein
MWQQAHQALARHISYAFFYLRFIILVLIHVGREKDFIKAERSRQERQSF